ncbi:hypothetical protein DPMN_174435 [Dreissena polymorpha]|uniref:Uncharacterized protein n=1 Tax=Dreissena polymorpha TaxID=45954 RepID=A0A9D4E6D7_DREPO|nr:hypothetical protein DPMN_174435 [Dreissena polymorpha]
MGQMKSYRKVDNLEHMVPIQRSPFLLNMNLNRVQKEKRVKVMQCLVKKFLIKVELAVSDPLLVESILVKVALAVLGTLWEEGTVP